jgi:hypothetical protein
MAKLFVENRPAMNRPALVIESAAEARRREWLTKACTACNMTAQKNT